MQFIPQHEAVGILATNHMNCDNCKNLYCEMDFSDHTTTHGRKRCRMGHDITELKDCQDHNPLETIMAKEPYKQPDVQIHIVGRGGNNISLVASESVVINADYLIGMLKDFKNGTKDTATGEKAKYVCTKCDKNRKCTFAIDGEYPHPIYLWQFKCPFGEKKEGATQWYDGSVWKRIE